MYKSLVIHHNNVPDLDMFDYNKAFVSSGDIDHYIHSYIIQEIKDYDFDIVYIKDSLSPNYLEFYGLLMAYHIRLSAELGKKRFVPIVILSDIDGFIVNKLTAHARVLFSKNVFIAENTISSVTHYNSLLLNKLSEKEYENNFLDKVEIRSPQESSHDIANKWAIYRWSDFLKIPISISKQIEKNKNDISSMLYFKYLVSKYPLPQERGLRFIPAKPTSYGKILLIDDEWKNGWKDIFRYYFDPISGINFENMNEIEKDTTYDELQVATRGYIDSFEPDLIILDMRLLQQDKKSDDTSGIELLKYIKEEINPGIQVIMLSASGKSKILDEANSYNILGYIKKEHPEDKGANPKDSFDTLRQLVDKGLERKYLKDIWRIQQEILCLDILRDEKTEKYSSIKLEITSIFEILDSDMNNKFNFVILSFAKSLETISNLYINEHTMKYDDNTAVGIYNSQNNMIYNHKDEKWYKNIENRLHNIMHKKLNIIDKKSHELLCELINCRNYIVHPKKKTPNGCELITKPNEDKIVEWFGLICEILLEIKRR